MKIEKCNHKLSPTYSADVFVVWSNTDLTEGRGTEYPAYICELESTAKRLARGSYVMGSDARYTKEKGYYIDNKWYFMGHSVPSSKEDDTEEARLEAERLRQEKKNKALEKAKALGLSEEDINDLK